MRVGTQQQAGGEPVTMPGTASSVARSRRRVAPPVIAAAVACAAIAIATLAVSMRGEPGIGASRNATAPATADVARSRVQASMAWVDGLAAGLIRSSDITSRLATQDPGMAVAVRTAWSDLDRSGDGVVPNRTLAWVDGLAAGLIRPSDVRSRLAAQDPEAAETVMAAWSNLNG